MSVLTIIFSVLSLVFGLLFLIDCIRFRKQINAYAKYGMAYGLILLAIDTALLIIIPDILKVRSIYELIAIDVVSFVRITVFTCMGMYCCSILGMRDNLVVSLLRRNEDRDKLLQKHSLELVGCTIILAVGYSVILFKLTMPQISELLKQMSEAQLARMGIGDRPVLLIALVVLEIAFVEEIVFRLGIQNYLARQFKLQGNRYWIAIVLTTLFWSLGHANTLDPEWVKIAQVFPLGLALGFLFRKYGIEICIFVHCLFNLIMMCLSPYLIKM